MQKHINLPKPEKRAGWQKILLLTICFSISLFGWLRFSGALSIYTLLLELGFEPHPLYYLLSGLVIGLSFLITSIGSALNRKWASVYVRLCSTVLIIHMFIEIFFIRRRLNIMQIVLPLAASVSLFILTSRKHEQNELAS